MAALVGWMLVVSALPAVLSPPASREVRVIIGFRERIDLSVPAAEGARVIRQLASIKAVAAYISEERLERLRSRPGVAYVELDAIVQALGETVPWGVERIGARLVHPYQTGDGVKVAVIDTGIDYNHPDLAGKVVGGVDFVQDDDDPMDDNGHGTHCAGIIAAVDNDIGVIGVAPGAGLYAVKVLDSTGSGYVSDVAAGIEWAVKQGAKVISMSLGSDSDSTTLRNACDAAYAAGVLLVAAAGNDYRKWGSIEFDTVDYPARYSSVIAVGATDQSDGKASWSSTGSALELAAPGVSINSTYKGGTYATMSGTSMACPHVAGTAALVWANEPGLTNAEVRARLQQTADDLGSVGWDKWYGYGLVDADEAAPLLVPQPPVAVAGPDRVLADADGTGREAATLDGSGSYDPDGGSIVSYDWSEGGTLLGSGAVIVYEFAVGIHTVTLKVTDDEGATGTDEVVITVNPNQPPVADAGPDKSAYVGDSVTFDGSGSYDPDGTIVSYGWSFGDGGIGTGVTVSHVYGLAGTYTVTLTVADNGGLIGTDTCTVTVTEKPAQPTMHVESIDMSVQTSLSRKRAVATVTILDSGGNPVQGATVYGSWSGLTSKSVSGTTGSDGKVTFYTSWIRGKTGTCTFAVTDVRKDGWVYDPSQNKETSDSITI